MTTTRIVVIGCLTGLLIRHTTGMGGTLFESIASLMGISVDYSTDVFDLYLEYQIVVGTLLGVLLCLLVLPYIFTHNHKAASLYIVLFGALIIIINLIHVDFDSKMRAARSVGMVLGAVVMIRTTIRLRSKSDPIAIYHQWQYVNRPEDWLHVLWPLILSPVCISYLYLLHPSMIKLTLALNYDYTAMLIVLYVLSFVILLPFVEELVFRRLFFFALRQKVSLLKAALISSLIFSLIHLDPARLVPAFIVGMVLALIYERTQSLVVCTAVHGVVNTFNYLAIDLLAGGGMCPELRLVRE